VVGRGEWVVRSGKEGIKREGRVTGGGGNWGRRGLEEQLETEKRTRRKNWVLHFPRDILQITTQTIEGSPG